MRPDAAFPAGEPRVGGDRHGLGRSQCGGRCEGHLQLSCPEPLATLEERLAETTVSAEALAVDAGLCESMLRGVGAGLQPRPTERAQNPESESVFPLLDELEDRALGLDAGIDGWRLHRVGTDG